MRWYQHPTRQLARTIELGEWNHFFVRRNLKNRIGRRINDPATSATLLLGEPTDHIGPAANNVTDDAAPGLSRKPVEQISGKSIRVRWERLREMHAGYLPMTGRAVLPRRRRTHTSPGASSVTTPLHAFERLYVPKTKPLQARQLESAARAGEVAQCIAADVTVGGGIRSLADTNAVEDDYRSALQLFCPV
jgi:hypothetical protein